MLNQSLVVLCIIHRHKATSKERSVTHRDVGLFKVKTTKQITLKLVVKQNVNLKHLECVPMGNVHVTVSVTGIAVEVAESSQRIISCTHVDIF